MKLKEIGPCENGLRCPILHLNFLFLKDNQEEAMKLHLVKSHFSTFKQWKQKTLIKVLALV